MEVKSGERNNRPALATALKLCGEHRTILMIAKLARNVAFNPNFVESNVKFVAVDKPEANRFVVRIQAAVAE